MYLNLVFFLFCARVITGEDASDEAKFIDLLPERDKQEFLDNIARRILEEVKPKESKLQSNEEVPDSQLDMHSDFVSKILKEEQENLMRRYINGTKRGKQKRNTPSSEDVSVKSQALDNEKNAEEPSKLHDRNEIDLTLRQGELSKKNEARKDGQTTKTVAQTRITEKYDTNIKDAHDDTLSIEITVNQKNTENKLISTPEKIQVDGSIIPVEVMYDANKGNSLNPNSTATAIDTANPTKYFEKYRNDDFDDTRKTEVKVKHDNKQVANMYNPYQETEKPNLEKSVTDENVTDTVKAAVDDSQSGKTINQYKEYKKSNDSTAKNTKEKLERINSNGNSITGPTISVEDISSISTRVKNLDDKSYNLSRDTEIKLPKSDNTENESNLYTFGISPSKITKNISTMVNPTVTASTLFTTKFVTKTNTEPTEIEFSTKTVKAYVKSNATREKKYSDRGVVDTILRSNTNGYVMTTEKIESKAQEKNTLKVTTPKIQSKTRKRFIRMSRIKNRNRKIKPKPLLEQDDVLIENNVKTEFDSKTFHALQDKYKKNKEYRVYEINPEKSPFVPRNPKPKSNKKYRNESSSKVEDGVPDNVEVRHKFLRTEDKAEEMPYYVPVHDYAPKYANYNPNNRLGPNFEDAEWAGDVEANNNFLRTENKAEETPYYIPVHDYAPNYAYFNPNNRLGPHFEDAEGNGDFESKNNFLRTEQKPEETPHYVPVNDYALKNAYFNPSIRLGPNTGHIEVDSDVFADQEIHSEVREDNVSDDADIESDESGRKRTYYRIRGIYNNQVQRKNGKSNRLKKKEKPKKPIVLKYPKEANTLFDDYFDVDYYFGRSNVVNMKSKKSKLKQNIQDVKTDYDILRFPNSNEHDHIMLENKIWGLVSKMTTTHKPHSKEKSGAVLHPPAEEDSKQYLRSRYGNVVLISPVKSQQTEKEQEPDYYFGGIVDSRELTAKHMTKKNIRSGKLRFKPRHCIGMKCKYIPLKEGEGQNKREENEEKTEEAKEEKKDEEKNDRVKKKKKITIEDMMFVANITDAKDIVKIILEMHTMMTRSRDNSFDEYFTVMEDMIMSGNRGLYQYDWLGTAVHIQAAMTKLLDLITKMHDGGNGINPSDLQLIHYVVYLHDISKAYLLKYRLDNGFIVNIPDSKVIPDKLRKVKKYTEPHSVELKDILSMNRARRNNQVRGRRNMDEVIALEHVEIPALLAFDPITKSFISRKEDGFEDKLEKLEMFLKEVQSGLNDLHDAIKNIAMVSKYYQKLYRNLKELYLSKPSRKEVLEVLLHIFGTRLLGLFEESCLNGLKKKDYEQYIDENEDTVQRTREEFVFVLRLVEELKKL